MVQSELFYNQQLIYTLLFYDLLSADREDIKIISSIKTVAESETSDYSA